MIQLSTQDTKWLSEVWEKVDAKMKKVAVRSYDKIPYTSADGVHDDRKNEPYMWTNGFWGGLMWLLYTGTGDESYKKAAIHSSEYVNRGLKEYEYLYHDVGFMSHIVNGAHFRLTGDSDAKNINLFMAAALVSRYNIDGGFIRAWNMDFAEGWSIIDSMMNLPLLYWASGEIGDPRFKRIAMAHADMALRDHIREDGAVNHIVFMTPRTDSRSNSIQILDTIRDSVRQAAGQEVLPGRSTAWRSLISTPERKPILAPPKKPQTILSHTQRQRILNPSAILGKRPTRSTMTVRPVCAPPAA